MGETDGFGVRVVVDGAWGFAASERLDAAEADRVAALAVRIARASATALRRRVVPRRSPARHGQLRDAGRGGPVRDPARGEDRRTLLDADGRLGAVKGVAFTESMLPRPSRVEDVRGDRRQLHRAGHHPGRRGRRGQRGRGRRAPAAQLPRRRRRLPGGRLRVHPRAGPGRPRRAARARKRSRCSPRRSARPGVRTIVLDPSQLYLQIHESCGHPTELDRVFGTEASYAGTSFLTTGQARRGLPVRLGAGRRSSPTRRRRAAWARSAGTTRASRPRRVPLIQDGIFVGYLSSAARRRRASGGRAAARCAPTAGTGSRSSA